MTTAILQLLLDATPVPPASAARRELLDAFGDVHRRRHAIIDELRAPTPITAAERALLDELDARDTAWRHALARLS